MSAWAAATLASGRVYRRRYTAGRCLPWTRVRSVTSCSAKAGWALFHGLEPMLQAVSEFFPLIRAAARYIRDDIRAVRGDVSGVRLPAFWAGCPRGQPSK